MKLKVLIATTLLCLALPAAADFQTVSLAYEVTLNNLTVPPSQNGRILFKECDECDLESSRMTPDTDFVVNGRSVRFEKFRAAMKKSNNAESVQVTVLHHLESGTAVRVSMTLTRPGNRNH